MSAMLNLSVTSRIECHKPARAHRHRVPRGYHGPAAAVVALGDVSAKECFGFNAATVREAAEHMIPFTLRRAGFTGMDPDNRCAC